MSSVKGLNNRKDLLENAQPVIGDMEVLSGKVVNPMDWWRIKDKSRL